MLSFFFASLDSFWGGSNTPSGLGRNGGGRLGWVFFALLLAYLAKIADPRERGSSVCIRRSRRCVVRWQHSMPRLKDPATYRVRFISLRRSLSTSRNLFELLLLLLVLFEPEELRKPRTACTSTTSFDLAFRKIPSLASVNLPCLHWLLKIVIQGGSRQPMGENPQRWRAALSKGILGRRPVAQIQYHQPRDLLTTCLRAPPSHCSLAIAYLL